MIAKRYQPFWQTKSLTEMNSEEWESICDGCGKCCLQKLEDEETETVYYTNLACRQLDISACQCKVYTERLEKVASCINLTAADLSVFHWLPDTCSYRLLHETGSLPDWHPLIVGNRQKMLQQGLTVSQYAINEDRVAEEDWETHIIRWVHGMPEPIEL
ncbi:YcgN family cysteine cluster protein [Marinomonas agarivorans]|nr:YcgN family cysteine cluster protein [Marinomonas agarivorans]